MSGPLVICEPCNARCHLKRGADVYPHRDDLAALPIWVCPSCAARVGCHPGTNKPLGKPANAETRDARIEAHEAFDKLWKTGRMKRTHAYQWMRDTLGLSREEAHIGSFSKEQCERLVDEIVKRGRW